MTPPSRAIAPFDYLQLAAIALIWGVNNVAAKIAVDAFPPMMSVALRFGLVLLVLSPWLRPPKQADWKSFAAMLAFTGSADTAYQLRSRENLLRWSVRVNVEADSLNSAVLGPDVEVGSATWELFVTDVARDITQKAGQKCTAIRRVLVPEAAMEAVREALIERLGGVRVGDPADEGVTMGPLATAQQLRDVRAGLARLQAESDVVHGGGAVPGKGYFVPPTLLAARGAGDVVHAHEVFGPVATLLQYDGAAEAAALVRRGGGGLVSSVYSDDRAFLGAAVFGIAAHHGRVFVGSGKLAGHSLGPGTVLPQLQHGGPGRAGGGAELGGLDGLGLYQQRVALQGDRPLIEALTR